MTPTPRRGVTPRLGLNARRALARFNAAEDMPPATCRAVQVDQNLLVPGGGDQLLQTDHWYAEGSGGSTVLIRTPYDRTGLYATARFVAERGHHVIVQNCRGTHGSDGVFNPLHDEVSDGQAALHWVREQPWSNQIVHTYGFSYAGVTQWAMCDGEQQPDAMVIGLSARRFDEAIVHPGGGFCLETLLAWGYALCAQEKRLPAKLWDLMRFSSRLRRGCATIPPSRAMLATTGEDLAYFTEWLDHPLGDPWWQPFHFADEPGSPPVTLLAGWQDLFLDGVFADFRALTDRGDQAKLIVGDWTHFGVAAGVVAVRELLRGLLLEPDPTPRIRLQVTGEGGHRELEHWPSSGVGEAFLLTPSGQLVPNGTRTETGTVAFGYDPADPTPSAGGRTLNPFTAGQCDQRARDDRDDVLVFTSAPLSVELTVLGEPEVELELTSTNPRVDVFVCLCDVDPGGTSRNLTDAYQRCDRGDHLTSGVRLSLRLAPMAHRFGAGHRMRLQVSAGAHPRYLRNPGTEDPAHDFTHLIPSQQRLGLGGANPTLLRIPRETADAASVDGEENQ